MRHVAPQLAAMGQGLRNRGFVIRAAGDGQTGPAGHGADKANRFGPCDPPRVSGRSVAWSGTTRP